jgi:hypothetical protein
MILPQRASGTHDSPLAKIRSFVIGTLLSILGVALGYAPLVPLVFGLIVFGYAARYLVRIWPAYLDLLGALPLIGSYVAEFVSCGMTARLRRVLIRATAAFLGVVTYWYPSEWRVMLGYVMAALLVECLTYIRVPPLR